MPTVRTILDALERLAPVETAFEWDRIGLQLGEEEAEVRTAAVALDPSVGLIDFAATHRAELILCHHPVIWDPLTSVTPNDRAGRLASEMIRRGMAFIGVHTNWDAAPGGINGRLSELLCLQDALPFGSGSPIAYSKMVVFAPAEAVEPLIEALARAGAGLIGLYERSAFWTPGTGTFLGGVGSHPAVGQSGSVQQVSEVRLEMRVPTSRVEAAVHAIRENHPYEEPAYDLYPLRPQIERPMGRIGQLKAPASLETFAAYVDAQLATRSWAFGDPQRRIQRVAVCGGAADDEWRAALAAGADAFVTGEVKHHHAVEAAESGLAILAAGHYATEHPGCEALAEAMAHAVPEVDWKVFVPESGYAGRPANGGNA